VTKTVTSLRVPRDAETTLQILYIYGCLNPVDWADARKSKYTHTLLPTEEDF